ncbi:hypothetical protein ACWFR1_38045 [Streptomyces sp. NPDC055103]
MPALRISHSSRPWTEALRGARAGVSAALCVVLPLAGHALFPGHTPRLAALALMAAVALPLCVVLTRRRLTDPQLLTAFAGAQLAHHVCYVVPGACTALAETSGPGRLSAVVEHASAGPGPSELWGGHAIALLLAARLLGVAESVVWHGRPVAESAGRILHAPVLLLALPAAYDPRRRLSADVPPLRPASLVRPHPGRAPPASAQLPLRPFRPSAVTGFRLAV